MFSLLEFRPKKMKLVNFGIFVSTYDSDSLLDGLLGLELVLLDSSLGEFLGLGGPGSETERSPRWHTHNHRRRT